MFPELRLHLSCVGYIDNQGLLKQAYDKVDKDCSGTLDFSEFLHLVYEWGRVGVEGGGTYGHFFSNEVNADTVGEAFSVMERALQVYDRDGSGTLETAELDAFFSKYLVQAVEAGAYKRPAEESVDFAGFMHLLYQVLCKSPGSTIQGKYAQTDKDLLAAGTGAQSSVWKRLRAAFQVLEDDFNRLDKNGDRVIDLTEVTAGISTKKQAVEKVARVSYLGVMSD